MTGLFFFSALPKRMTSNNECGLFGIRCRFVEIDGQDALEIDDLQQLGLANVLARLSES